MKTKINPILNSVIMFLAGIAITACSALPQTGGSFAQLPVGKAYVEGKEIFFTHTEASDAGIAETLTNVMKSPVLYVPALVEVPASALIPRCVTN